MLGKLLKYDLKRIFNVLFVFYALALLFAILTRIFLFNSSSTITYILGMFSSGAFISMLFNILINSLMRCWVVFKKSFYDDESYLTHTLPIKKNTLYLSKIVLAMITLLISIIVMAVTIFVAYYTKDNFELVKSYFLGLESISNGSALGILALIISVFYIEMLCVLSSGYTGFILGNKMQSDKMAFSVGFGFLAYAITQMLVLLIAFHASFFISDVRALFSSLGSAESLRQFGILALIIYTIILIIIHIFNNYNFNKGVNVD